MKKLDLNKVAEEFEIISDEHQLWYNLNTGEFEVYIDPMYTGMDDDYEKYDGAEWIPAPDQRELDEYRIMVSFTGTVRDSQKKELLDVALEGRGAFRRFKDTLYRVGLTDEWYAYRHKAFVEKARSWCEWHEIDYVEDTDTDKPESTASDIKMES